MTVSTGAARRPDGAPMNSSSTSIDTAPHSVGDVRPHSGRLRRRGPRSAAAALRRRPGFVNNPPPAGDPCNSGSAAAVQSSPITISHANIRGYISHRAELEARLRAMAVPPTLVCLNETFLGRSIKSIKLSGYSSLSRLDRRTGQKGGGIAVLILDESAAYCISLGRSDTYERSWHRIHTDHGPVLLCVWYRPPRVGEVASIMAMRTELDEHAPQCIATIVVGDINVHHVRWLYFSNRIAPEGRELCKLCGEYGLRECVREPTRENHLLDLVLTDMDTAVACEVLPEISDHRVILATLQLSAPVETAVDRVCWDFGRADWAMTYPLTKPRRV